MNNRLSNLGIIAVCCVLAGATCFRNMVWRNEVSLWSDSAAKAPNKAQPSYQLGLAYARSGNNDKAFTYMQRASEIDAGFLTKALSQTDMTEKTIEDYLALLRINPNQPLVRNQLGIAYDKKGLLNEAIKEYRTSLDLDPTNSAVHCNLGITYYEMRMQEDAIKEFHEAIRLDPNDPEPHARLAMVFISAGKLADAVDELRRALKINPEHVGSKKLLNETMQLLQRRNGGAARN